MLLFAYSLRLIKSNSSEALSTTIISYDKPSVFSTILPNKKGVESLPEIPAS